MRSSSRWAIAACAVLAVVLPSSAVAQDPPGSIPLTLTPELAREILLMQNPEILAERENIAVARAGLLDARVRPNPIVSVISEGYPLFESDRGPFLRSGELIVRVAQPIEIAGKRGKRGRAATHGVEAAQHLLQDTIRQLELELKTRYAGVVHAKTHLAQVREALAEFDDTARLTELRHEQGEASTFDVVRVETVRSHFVDDLIRAETVLENAKLRLLELLGAADLQSNFDVSQTLEFQPLGTDLAVEEFVAQALEKRGDLQARRELLNREQAQLNLEKARRVPDVTPFLGYHRHYDENAVTFGVQMELPFFNRNQGGVARAVARGAQAEQEQRRMELSVRREVYEAYRILRAHERRVEAFAKTTVPSAARARDVALPAYRLGALDLVVFLDAEDAYRHTLRSYTQALLDHRIARFGLEAAIGGALP